MVFMGLDPGASGGWAVISGVKVFCGPLPKELPDLWKLLSGWTDCRAALEQVGGYVGGDGHPGSAMFNFGRGYGRLEMALTAAGICYDGVVPRSWQKANGVDPKGKQESKADFKRRLKARAEELFPQCRPTLATADALLIARWCAMRWGNWQPSDVPIQ